MTIHQYYTQQNASLAICEINEKYPDACISKSTEMRQPSIDCVLTIYSDVSDVQRINIPVFLQLDIPILWDKTKVYGALDGLRLNGTPDMNIKIKAISMDDLNMYADIAEKVLCNVNELRSEINKMMSTMLLEADIDTTKNAEFDVNLEVQDISGNVLFNFLSS